MSQIKSNFSQVILSPHAHPHSNSPSKRVKFLQETTVCIISQFFSFLTMVLTSFVTVILLFYLANVRSASIIKSETPLGVESQQIMEPFYSPSFLNNSPFYKHEHLIAYIVSQYITMKRTDKVVQFLKKVISNEHQWRLNLCHQMLGKWPCQENNFEPFYIWKKNLVHRLTSDPTLEIVRRLEDKVNFSQ